MFLGYVLFFNCFPFVLLHFSILTRPYTPSCAFTGTFLMWTMQWKNLLIKRKVC